MSTQRDLSIAGLVILACTLAGVCPIQFHGPKFTFFAEPPGFPGYRGNALRARSFRTGLVVPGLNFDLHFGPQQPEQPDALHQDLPGPGPAQEPLTNNGFGDPTMDRGFWFGEQTPATTEATADAMTAAVGAAGVTTTMAPPGRVGGLFRGISDFGNQLSRQVFRRAENEAGIVFHLYTRQNMEEPEMLSANDSMSIANSNYKPRNPTKFIIHGFNSKQGPGSGGVFLKDALLGAGDFNVITVDWSGVDPKVYPVDVSSAVPQVGAGVAEMIRALAAGGSSLDDMHIIGHSLGAHIAGVAGSLVLGPEGAGRITGLDPAGPLFEGRDAGSRLDPSDAGFVDAIHTDGGLLGIAQPVGHIDFYVEGGRHSQPACGLDVIGFCSHCFAFEVMEDAIRNPGAEVAASCLTWESYTRGECDDQPTDELGLNTNRSSRGTFFLHTRLVPSLPLRMVGRPISAAGEVSRAYTGGQTLSPRC